MRTLCLCCHELFNPHLRCWRMQCFFWELGERGSCSFSRREKEIKRSLPLLYEASPQMYVWRPSPRPPWAFRLYIQDRAVCSHTPHLLHHHHHSHTHVPACDVPHTLSQPLCQLCLPASSFYEHLRIWMHWLCKLKTTRKVDDENCQRSTKVARFASLPARCQVLKGPQWQHAHIQVFQCLSWEWSHLFPSFPQQSPETVKDINVTLQHNIILRSETSCGQVKLLEK